MTRTAKIFTNGRSQAVRLPAEFRFEGKEVFIRRDPATGDVVLSKKAESPDEFFALARRLGPVEDIMDLIGPRDEAAPIRDPFKAGQE